jgi:surface antigen
MGFLRTTLVALVTAVALAFGGAGLAFNEVRLLNDAVVRDFSDKDWELAWGTVQEALSSAGDGETLTWENPETGAFGSATPSATTDRDGTVCRSLTMVNNARNQRGESTLEYCRKPDGTWGILSPSASP